MSKFNVGDKVKVRKNLKVNERYEGVLFAPDMEKYKGQIITIEGLIHEDYINAYRYDDWSWTDEMLEPVETTKEDEKPEMVNHPKHYNSCGDYETIRKIELLFGKEHTLIWAKIQAFRYRDRLGFKDIVEQDTAKMDWYFRYVEENE